MIFGCWYMLSLFFLEIVSYFSNIDCDLLPFNKSELFIPAIFGLTL